LHLPQLVDVHGRQQHSGQGHGQGQRVGPREGPVHTAAGANVAAAAATPADIVVTTATDGNVDTLWSLLLLSLGYFCS